MSGLIKDKHLEHKMVAFQAGPPARALADGAATAAKRVLKEFLAQEQIQPVEFKVHWPRPPREPGWCIKIGETIVFSGEDDHEDMVTTIAVKQQVKVKGKDIPVEDVVTRLREEVSKKVTRYIPEVIVVAELQPRGHNA